MPRLLLICIYISVPYMFPIYALKKHVNTLLSLDIDDNNGLINVIAAKVINNSHPNDKGIDAHDDRENYNEPERHSPKESRQEVPASDCVMNQINCALSGAKDEKLKTCLDCARVVYSDTKCELLEPNFLEYSSDLSYEGLTPLNIQPKIAPNELIEAFDYAHSMSTERDRFCTDSQCLRLIDPKSCIIQLPPQNQMACGSCWIFANTLHLEILICMESKNRMAKKLSEMYISSCLKLKSRDACAGGNAIDFAEIISEYKFIPSKSDFNYKLPLDQCPRWNGSWTNQKPLIDLIPPGSNSLNTFPGFILIRSVDYIPNRTESLITLIKEIVKEKGSVVISMKGKQVLKPSHDGRKVLNLCHTGVGTHAMVIIGYGVYQKGSTFNPRRKFNGRYWIIRNSWGKHWGDNGNFKLDMVLTFSPKKYTSCRMGLKDVMDMFSNTPVVALNVKIRNNHERVPYGYLPGGAFSSADNTPKEQKIVRGVIKRIRVKYGERTYSRNVFVSSGEDFHKDIQCIRAYSFSGKRDAECRELCRAYIDSCKNYKGADIGMCIFSQTQDRDCMMCGV